MNMKRINYAMCIHRWESIFNRNYFPKMKDFSRLGALQAVMYTVKVVVSEISRDNHIVTTHH